MLHNIIVTGGTGFLGKILVSGLEGNVISLGRAPENTIICDLSKEIPKIPTKTNIIIHSAGKAHKLPKTPLEEKEFFEVNTLGTKHLLEGIEISGAKLIQMVFISTVAVYGHENGVQIEEDFPLEGNSPYALSKIQAEKLMLEWGKRHHVPVLIFRLPLIVGENPPGNLGKMIHGIKNGKYLSINEGQAKRSMVLADDLANCIKENIGKEGIYNLTDGMHPSFKEVEKEIVDQLGTKMPKNLPKFAAKILCFIGDIFPKFPFNSNIYSKMSNDLTFCDKRARKELMWKPRKALDHFQITVLKNK